MDTRWNWESVFIVVVILLIIVAFAGMATESKRWEEFKAAHECKVVGKMDGEIFNTVGFSANGQMTVGVGSTSGKTGWACNDGITYWK